MSYLCVLYVQWIESISMSKEDGIAMVVPTKPRPGSASSRRASWSMGVARTMRDLIQIGSAETGLRNARSAAELLLAKRCEREEVEQFLAARAAAALARTA